MKYPGEHKTVLSLEAWRREYNVWRGQCVGSLVLEGHSVGGHGVGGREVCGGMCCSRQ